ncbi:unnamed protein product, partial [Mesorhabditis spiculigera]
MGLSTRWLFLISLFARVTVAEEHNLTGALPNLPELGGLLEDVGDVNNVFPTSMSMESAVPHGVCVNASDPSERLECEKAFHMGKNSRLGDETVKNETQHLKVKGRLSASSFQPMVLADCIDYPCISKYLLGKITNAPFLYNKKRFGNVPRKEFRVMSDAERKRFFDALNLLKKNGVYDRWSDIHQQMSTRGTAHQGSNFLPWHREHLKRPPLLTAQYHNAFRLELELRRIDADISIPFWDSTVDAKLPVPADSVMWSPELLGNTFGPITTGAFEGWQNEEKKSGVIREVGVFPNSHPLTIAGVRSALSFSTVDDVLAQSKKISTKGCGDINYNWLDIQHNHVHNFVGGDMRFVQWSSRDPTFLLHHAFIDFIWEGWRMLHQTEQQRDSEYPNDACINIANRATTLMYPFRLRNIDGLSNAYTRNLYHYWPAPRCTKETADCEGSRFLFCDTRDPNAPQCVSKVRVGGSCAGFEQSAPMDVCYRGVCVGGRCVEKDLTSPTGGKPVEYPAQNNAVVEERCLDRHPCCQSRASPQLCRDNPAVRLLCPASCTVCVPKYYWPTSDCSDRLRNCYALSQRGACNVKEYITNCRGTCGHCQGSCEAGVTSWQQDLAAAAAAIKNAG